MSVNWNYFNKFEDILDKYMPSSGEGETIASQTVTAVNKLVYKWYNDGDVFDNMYFLDGWCNDLSSYANWLWNHTDAAPILDGISSCINGGDYEDLLKELADELLNEESLTEMAEEEKTGSIYKCKGPYRFVEKNEDGEYEY